MSRNRLGKEVVLPQSLADGRDVGSVLTLGALLSVHLAQPSQSPATRQENTAEKPVFSSLEAGVRGK